METVTVPNVVDKSQEDAVLELERAGFQVILEEEFSKKAPGMVISQSCEAETKVKKGTEIHLTVSLGEEGRDAAIEVTMENIVGLSFAEAEELLSQKALYLEKSEVYSDSVPEGIIISQSEPENTVLYQGDTVKVVVSAGKETVEIPDVETKMLDNATAELEALGLTWKVREEYSDSYAKGQVIEQDLKPTVSGRANMVEKGTEITLTVSKGRRPVNNQPSVRPTTAASQTSGETYQATQAPETQPAIPQPSTIPETQSQTIPETQPPATTQSETLVAPFEGEGANIQDFIRGNGNVGAN